MAWFSLEQSLFHFQLAAFLFLPGCYDPLPFKRAEHPSDRILFVFVGRRTGERNFRI
jgi:hypothetical protein